MLKEVLLISLFTVIIFIGLYIGTGVGVFFAAFCVAVLALTQKDGLTIEFDFKKWKFKAKNKKR